MPVRASSGPPRPPRGSLFRGWHVVAGAFVITLVGFGDAYSFSPFIEPLQRNFDASRGSVSLIFSLAGFLYFVVGVGAGRLAGRWGARQLALVGMLLIGIGLVLAGMARTYAEVYVAYSLGVGFGVGLSYAPVVAAVQRWFVRQRGLASELAVCGIGVGTLVAPPFVSWLIGHFGWRDAYIVLGAASAVVGGVASLLIADDPADHGLAPDGDIPIATPQPEPGTDLPLAVALRSWRFIGLYLSGVVLSFGLYVPFVQLVPYAEGHGIGATRAALLISMIGIGSTAGRFFLGSIADHAGRSRTLVVMFAGIGLSMLMWQFSVALWSLMSFAFAFGIFYGGFVAIVPSVVMDDFGSRDVSSLIGVLFSSNALGVLAGPSLAGFAFDLDHSYTIPIFGCAASGIIAAILFASTAGSNQRLRARMAGLSHDGAK